MTVPSHIVRMIRGRYPNLADHTSLNTQPEVTFVAGILAAVKQLPPTIIPADLATQFAVAVGSLERGVESCSADIRRGHLGGGQVREVLRLLESLPDEPFRPDDTSLQFIDDVEFRRTLSADVAATHRALSNGEWKAATVLAGSVIEALCLWAIISRSNVAAALAAARTLREAGTLRDTVNNDLLRWHATELIEVAFALGLIVDDTVRAARSAKDYRNLIHPGREQRTGHRPTEGSALIAVGAMQRIVENLQPAAG